MGPEDNPTLVILCYKFCNSCFMLRYLTIFLIICIFHIGVSLSFPSPEPWWESDSSHSEKPKFEFHPFSPNITAGSMQIV